MAREEGIARAVVSQRGEKSRSQLHLAAVISMIMSHEEKYEGQCGGC